MLTLGILQGIAAALLLALLGPLWGTKSRATSVAGKVSGETAYRAVKNCPDGGPYSFSRAMQFPS